MIFKDKNIFKLIFIGLIAGIIASFVGGGTGILIVPLLIFLNVMNNYKEAVGTSLLALSLPITSVAVYFYYNQKCNGRSCVNWRYALIISLFFIIGTLASCFTSRIDTKNIKLIYGIMIMFLGLTIVLSDINLIY
jgi:uncharacterized membrane protein YfcA